MASYVVNVSQAHWFFLDALEPSRQSQSTTLPPSGDGVGGWGAHVWIRSCVCADRRKAKQISQNYVITSSEWINVCIAPSTNVDSTLHAQNCKSKIDITWKMHTHKVFSQITKDIFLQILAHSFKWQLVTSKGFCVCGYKNYCVKHRIFVDRGSCFYKYF